MEQSIKAIFWLGRGQTDLSRVFDELGIRVGPRTGFYARTHDEKEWWCLRRYIFTLSAAGQLEFPISIEKSERPDFRCTFASRHLGIEVVEATHPSDQREMTEFERTKVIVLLGTYGGRFKSGAGNPERAWRADVLRQVRAKSRAINAYPNRIPEYALVLYTNSNAGTLTYEWPRVFRGLGPMNERVWKHVKPLIKSIAVICDEWLLMLEPGRVLSYPLRSGVEEEKV
jgi:hypothetical protein